jgi:hypothetical protein
MERDGLTRKDVELVIEKLAAQYTRVQRPS